MRRTRFIAPASIVTAAVLLGTAAFALAGRGASAGGNVGAPVRAGATGHTVSVGGHGETAVAPDQATITVGVETRGSDAQSALSDNSSRMSAVIAAIKNQGVPADHIQTANLNIYFDTDHQSYVVNHQLTVRIDNVDKTGSILDAAVAAGANNAWNVSFDVKDTSAARSAALQAAVADARKRADAMATALGVSITGVGSASEASYSSVPPIRYAAAAPATAVSSTPINPGQETITADVNVVYTFG